MIIANNTELHLNTLINAYLQQNILIEQSLLSPYNVNSQILEVQINEHLLYSTHVHNYIFREAKFIHEITKIHPSKNNILPPIRYCVPEIKRNCQTLFLLSSNQKADSSHMVVV